MTILDIAPSPATIIMLKANGRSDKQRGISMHRGWQGVCAAIGFDSTQRTPASEAYEDGYYEGPPQ